MMKPLRKRLEFMNANLRILTIRQSLSGVFRRMVTPYSSLYILALGGDGTQVGVVNSLQPLAGLLMFPISGYLTDRRGRVKLIALAGYLSALTMLLYLFAPSWEWIALGALLQGFMVFEYPPTSAILADSIDSERRGTAVATMNTVSGVLSMFSPFLAGVILEFYGDNWGMRILYGLLVLSQVVNATLVLRFLEETAPATGSGTRLDPVAILRESYGGIPELLRIMPRSVKALGFLVGLGFVANGIASPYWVVYITDVIGLSKVDWGLILVVESLFKLVLTIPCGVIGDRYGRTRTVFVAVLISLVSIPSLIVARSFFHVLLIRFAASLAMALFMPSATALMADYVPRDQRGRVMAAIGRGSVMIGAMGAGSGGPNMGYMFILPLMASSLLGGLLYSLNPAYPWICVLGTTLLQLASIVFFIRDPEKAEK
ncbi:MFS transporter [Candidatus Bathyarchaeota archaeon]|nr:MFS transporter [Candidatus Bathyarchaeota archaeon]MBL7079139.1 MFS transporter [Candidatus Bathyarchaeota archaeon]